MKDAKNSCIKSPLTQHSFPHSKNQICLGVFVNFFTCGRPCGAIVQTRKATCQEGKENFFCQTLIVIEERVIIGQRMKGLAEVQQKVESNGVSSLRFGWRSLVGGREWREEDIMISTT